MEEDKQLRPPTQQQRDEYYVRRNPWIEVLTAGPLQLLVSLIIPVIAFIVLWRSFIFMRDSEASKVSIAIVALLVGVFGIWVLYIAMNNLVERLPIRFRDALRPYIFVGPAMAVLTVFLVYPSINTVVRSLMDKNSEEWVGLENYETIFTNAGLLSTMKNNVLWIVVVTTVTVSVGLLIAVLVDRIGRWEPLAKALIFLPMAISAVGASVIWKFMYHKVSFEGRPQIGLVNAVMEGLGLEPIAFIRESPINNYALMAVMIWLWTGFCMVILSSAVKGVPEELLEAARIDGASEVVIFFRVIIPVISPTILTVSTTILIMVLKVFDIVYVFKGQLYDANVVANEMFIQLFQGGDPNYGLGSALATLLLIAVLPLIFWNIRSLRKERG